MKGKLWGQLLLRMHPASFQKGFRGITLAVGSYGARITHACWLALHLDGLTAVL